MPYRAPRRASPSPHMQTPSYPADRHVTPKHAWRGHTGGSACLRVERFRNGRPDYPHSRARPRGGGAHPRVRRRRAFHSHAQARGAGGDARGFRRDPGRPGANRRLDPLRIGKEAGRGVRRQDRPLPVRRDHAVRRGYAEEDGRLLGQDARLRPHQGPRRDGSGDHGSHRPAQGLRPHGRAAQGTHGLLPQAVQQDPGAQRPLHLDREERGQHLDRAAEAPGPAPQGHRHARPHVRAQLHLFQGADDVRAGGQEEA